jgi:hypothetical protein
MFRSFPRTSFVAMVVRGAWLVIGHACQDPCHGLHSCPSDYKTYVCGDKGRYDQCPDNEFCFGRKPRAAIPSPTHRHHRLRHQTRWKRSSGPLMGTP